MSWAEVKKINSNLLKSLDSLVTEQYNALVTKLNTNKTAIDTTNTNVTNSKNAIMGAMSKQLVASDNVKINKAAQMEVSNQSCMVYCRFIPKYSGVIKLSYELIGSSYGNCELYALTLDPYKHADGATTYNGFLSCGYPEGTVTGVNVEMAEKIGYAVSSSVWDPYTNQRINVVGGNPIIFVVKCAASTSSATVRIRNFKISYDEAVL